MHWNGVAYWAITNLAIGILGPFFLGLYFVRYHPNPKPSITLRRFYEKGELGLAGLLIALAVIGDFRKTSFSDSSVHAVELCLYLLAFMAASTWAIPLCNNVVGAPVDWNKVWNDSCSTVFAVFTVGLVLEIILEMQ